MPVNIGIAPVPEVRQPHHVMERYGFSIWKTVPRAPIANLFRRAEKKNHRAVLVDILPSSGRRNCKMHPAIIKSDWLTFDDSDCQWFSFATEPGMKLDFTSNQGSNTQST